MNGEIEAEESPTREVLDTQQVDMHLVFGRGILLARQSIDYVPSHVPRLADHSALLER